MKDCLLTYLSKRLEKKDEDLSPESIVPGPVVTISREVGCAGLKLAKKLAKKLNKQGGKCVWKVFSKEIFKEAASHLEMDHAKLEKILKTEGRNTFDEILGALSSKRFKSERKIRKAVIDFIRTIATDGHCIIVGRGSHLITHDIENSLHIRFYAPLGWRIKKIAKRHAVTEGEAKKFIIQTEKERESVRANIHHGLSHSECYHLEVNVSEFSPRDVVKIIRDAMELKGLLKGKQKKMGYPSYLLRG